MSMHRSTARTLPNTAAPTNDGFGVDTVVLVVPVKSDSVFLDDPVWKSQRSTNHDKGNSEVFAGKVKVNGVEVRLDLYVQDLKVKLEFNAPRMICGPPLLLPPDALEPLVDGVLNQIASTFEPTFAARDADTGELVFEPDWAKKVQVRQLDIARNMEVPNKGAWIAHCQASRAKYGRLRQINNGKSWSAVDRTKKDGSDTLYMKNGPWGEIFRFEARLKRRRLKAGGIARLSDVSGYSCWVALHNRWAASGHGKPFTVPGVALDRLKKLPAKEQGGVLGYLAMAELGEATGHSRSSARRLSKLAESVGLTPGVPLGLQGGERHRVDLYLGKQVVVT